MSSNKTNICIYAGPGVSKDSQAHTEHMLHQFVGCRYQIHFLEPDEVKSGDWCQNAALFVLPGGADIPYVRRLTPQANLIIRKFVQEGGSFLGICAGSYYASSYVSFAVGSTQSVQGPRELAFFPDKVVGPCLLPYNHKTYSGACAANLLLPNVSLNVFFNGGGYFHNASQYPEITVLAKYTHEPAQPAAIIQREFTKGRVVLSGVHFEYSPNILDRSDPYLDKIAYDLAPYEGARQSLCNQLLSFLRV